MWPYFQLIHSSVILTALGNNRKRERSPRRGAERREIQRYFCVAEFPSLFSLPSRFEIIILFRESLVFLCKEKKKNRFFGFFFFM